jgi:hypothetical protein
MLLLALLLMVMRVALVPGCARASVHKMKAVQWMYHEESIRIESRSCG